MCSTRMHEPVSLTVSVCVCSVSWAHRTEQMPVLRFTCFIRTDTRMRYLKFHWANSVQHNQHLSDTDLCLICGALGSGTERNKIQIVFPKQRSHSYLANEKHIHHSELLIIITIIIIESKQKQSRYAENKFDLDIPLCIWISKNFAFHF